MLLRIIGILSLLLFSSIVQAKNEIYLEDGQVVKKEAWMLKIESHVRKFLSYKDRTAERATCDFEIETDAKGMVRNVFEIICFPSVTKEFPKQVIVDIQKASPLPVPKEYVGKPIYITVDPY